MSAAPTNDVTAKRTHLGMRYLSWLITVPLAVLAVLFAVSNMQAVNLSLWPLPFEMQTALFVVVLLTLVLGFLAGGFVAWTSASRHRHAVRRATRRVQELTTELQEVRARLADAERRLATSGQPRTIDAPPRDPRAVALTSAP